VTEPVRVTIGKPARSHIPPPDRLGDATELAVQIDPHVGPCVRCRRPCRRYGPQGRPSCATCQATEVIPAPLRQIVAEQSQALADFARLMQEPPRPGRDGTDSELDEEAPVDRSGAV